jgi:hypothetical protein
MAMKREKSLCKDGGTIVTLKEELCAISLTPR